MRLEIPEINIHVHIHDESGAEDFRFIKHTLGIILDRLGDVMATIDQVVQDVNDESTAIDSVVVLIAGLRQQVADALSGVTLPPDTQTKLDAVFSTAESNKAKLATALATAPTGQPVTPATP
jgi:predicted metal-dependent enzyme (double-stranded beta helix superfamily)